MTANPILKTHPSAVDPLFALEAHIAKLNNYNWVRDSGRLYFIGKRERADGTTEHYVDRAA